MAGTTMFYINPEKLNQEFKKRNLNLTEVAKEIGVTQSAITQALKRKSMAKAWAATIDHCFRIPPESYDFNNKGGDVKKVELEVKRPQTGIDYDKLYKTIYTAAFNAMKQAWGEM